MTTATHADFARIAETEGLPLALPLRVRQVMQETNTPIPTIRGRIAPVTPAPANACNLDGFDCRLCDARSAHDQALVDSQRANRQAQWDIKQAVRDGNAKAQQQLADLEREELQIAGRRFVANASQGHGHCAHCGGVVKIDQNPAQHAPAGFEHLDLRMDVLHCDACARTDACHPARATPGSNLPDGCPGGFCEFPPTETTVGMELAPGLRWLLRIGAALGGLVALAIGSTLTTLINSQGQQKAIIEGTANQGICQQDSTSGHGYNAGTLSFYGGSAPANGNAVPSATWLADLTLPNPLAGAGTGLPSVSTWNAISPGTISNSGTVNHARITTNASTGVPTPEDNLLSTTERRLQFDVATSAATCIVNTTAFSAGGSISVTSATFQAPA